MSAIEAVYIFDEHNNLIIEHVYTGRPPLPSSLLHLYLQYPTPRPSLTYHPSTHPPSLLHSMTQDNLLFLSPSSTDIDPMFVLEFLHRLADSLEEFLGSPLIANKITANYDIAAQILAEIADAGVPCQGEPNALRDVVETGPGTLSNFLGKVGLPASSPALGAAGSSSAPNFARPQIQTPAITRISTIPWRRANVRHTSNELYVDIVESLSVILAPSGRALTAFARGSIAFTSKVSGVPDLVLNLGTGGKGAGMGGRAQQLGSVMERVVFHPCVRLQKWNKDGVVSFVPPDGRFVLCGYEVDLLGGADEEVPLRDSRKLDLPASVDVSTGLGSSGNEFEVRLSLSNSGSHHSAAAASLQSNLGGGGGGNRLRTGRAGSAVDVAKTPALDSLSVKVPVPPAVRNLSDLRPSKGEAHWSPGDGAVEWRVAAKDLGSGGAVLRCAVQGPLSGEGGDVNSNGGILNGMTATTYDFDEYDDKLSSSGKPLAHINGEASRQLVERNQALMPSCATLSFSAKGWLASGLKVESLLVDTNKSKGLGEGVRPYKGVKYVCVSRDGIETRC